MWERGVSFEGFKLGKHQNQTKWKTFFQNTVSLEIILNAGTQLANLKVNIEGVIVQIMYFSHYFTIAEGLNIYFNCESDTVRSFTLVNVVDLYNRNYQKS